MVKISDKPLSDVFGEDYGTIENFCKACLIDLNEPGEKKIFSKCKLPVYTPDGAILRRGVYAAAAYLAGARRGVNAPPDVKKAAARKLIRLYKEMDQEPPENLLKIAEVDSVSDITEESKVPCEVIDGIPAENCRWFRKRRRDSEQLNTSNIYETNDEIVAKCIVMRTGVYNGKLKTSEELKKSVRWWEGVPIVVDNPESIGDHPDTGIVTADTIRVGQLRNVSWDESNQAIVAEAHFYKSDLPEWLKNSLQSNKPLGVSGAYFCDFVEGEGEFNGVKYDAIEVDYVPNNLAIVRNPACKIPKCGINVNKDRKNMEVCNMSENITTVNAVHTAGTDNSAQPVQNAEKIIRDKDQEIALLNTKIAQLQAQIVELNSAIEEYQEKERQAIIEAKKAKFLAQFPEQNREIAEKELLPIFLERPDELILNASRIAELMTVPKTSGQEYVKVEKNSELEPPSIDELRKII